MQTAIQNEDGTDIEKPSSNNDDSIFTDSVASQFNQAISKSQAYIFYESPDDLTQEVIIKPPNLANIVDVALDIRSSLVLHPREALSQTFSRYVFELSGGSSSSSAAGGTDWLGQLFSCFDAAIEIGRKDALTAVFQILKTFFVVVSPQALIRLVDDDVYETVLSILQYDSEIPQESQVNHLSLVASKSSFRQLHSDIPPHIRQAIRQSFRLVYIKDSVLARYLDDVAFMAFIQAINSLNSQTITYFIEHPAGFMDSLLTSHASSDLSGVFDFVQSVLSSARTMTIDEKASIVVELCDDKFFSLLEANLVPTSPLRNSVLEIVIAVSTLNPPWVRARSLSSNFLTVLLSTLHDDSNQEYQTSQIADLLRLLLEPAHLAESFLNDFYEKDFLTLLATFSPNLPPFTTQTILDLLAYCVVSHSATYKSYFLRFGSLGKTLRSILIGKDPAATSSRMVQLAAIRLVRAFFWQKDPMYFRFLQAFNIPGLILQLLFLHRPNNVLIDGNMIYSSCLEIVTFVCVNNQTHVIETLCRPDTESERIINVLATETSLRAHSELAQFMLTTVERLRNPQPTTIDDMNSRQSITSSRGRSLSPRPLLVPIPRPRRQSSTIDEEEEELTNFKRFRFSTDSP